MKRGMWLLMVLAVPAFVLAQTKIGHINSEQIMAALPEAQDAQKSLDNMVSQWEGELQKMQADWKKKFDEYDKKKLILTDQERSNQEKGLRDLIFLIFPSLRIHIHLCV